MSDQANIETPAPAPQAPAPAPAPEQPRQPDVRMYTEDELEQRLAAARSDFTRRNKTREEEIRAEYEAKLAEQQQQSSEGERLRRDALKRAGRARLEKLRQQREARQQASEAQPKPQPYAARATAPGAASPAPVGYREYLSALERGDSRLMRKLIDKHPELPEFIKRHG